MIGLQGPWSYEHCPSPRGTGIGSISAPFLTAAMPSDYSTPSLSPPMEPAETLVSPLFSLGLDYDSLANFALNEASYPQKEAAARSRDENTESPSTMKQMRRREQNRKS